MAKRIPIADYNILTPYDLNELIFNPFKQALGNREYNRIQRQLMFYQYYEGYQHLDKRTGHLVKADELERPAGLDYDPTRYTTNYFKSFVQRKSRWQMGGKHGIAVKPLQIDPVEGTVLDEYKPTPAQASENKKAEALEVLLADLWKQNKMREKLLQASRDRLIAGNVVAKLMFNNRTGKLHIIFRPATEFIPVYSEDDFEELLAGVFIQQRENDEGQTIYWKQTFSLEDDGLCYLHEALYNENLDIIREITPKASMGLDFIPVVEFPVQDLSGEVVNNTETENLKELNDILNQLNEDAIDSLKFEMFSMTALIGVPEGTANKVQIAPGSVLEISGGMNGQQVNVQKVEGGFRWKDAYKETYARVKGAMHEISHLPQVVPQELNFGGLNGEALHVLFHSIIQETEEHWLVWQDRLQELNEKAVRYLQARVNERKFNYDKQTVKTVGDRYDHEIKFVLPLPENRKDLVDLLTIETASGFESTKGAIERLGVEHTNLKLQEIKNEKQANVVMLDPYGNGAGGNANAKNEAGNNSNNDDETGGAE